MRAIITGATGFIGNHLVTELRKREWEVICIVRRPVKWDDPGIICVSGDLLQQDSMNYSRSQIGHANVLFHLAAVLPTHQPLRDDSLYLVANALATIRLLRTAADLGVRCFVYASSLSVIGKPEQLPVTEDHPPRPLDLYSLSKLCGELAWEMVRRIEHLQITSLRITSPYGPGMSPGTVLPRFVAQAVSSQDILWFGTGQRTQNFVHVHDVVRAFLLAADSPSPLVYNVAGNTSISMQALAELVVRLTPGSHSRARASGTPDPQDDHRWEIDLTRSKSGLGYHPMVSLEEGLAEYIDSVRGGATVYRWWSAR